jgi:membrane peptidoglycan carboxypeptidase
MNNRSRWRQPQIYVRALRKLGAQAASAAYLRRSNKPPRTVEPQRPAGALPPFSVAKAHHLPPPSRPTFKFFVWLTLLALVSAMAWGIYLELRSSTLQAGFFAELAQKMKYAAKPGASPAAAIRYPQDSPYDERLGYSNLPEFFDKLQTKDFQITEQSRMSPDMTAWIDRGLFTPYREKVQAGLTIQDCRNQSLFVARYPERIYPSFDATPALLIKSLLFIENRELLDTQYPKRNPAVEWDRLSRSVLDQAVHGFNSEHKSAGGSTLATQIEKYRHSPEGRTTSITEKLRQMASATLRAYQSGEDTTTARRQLVVDYLNTVPLSAKPGYGEVNGMGDGLWVWYGRDFAEVNQALRDSPATGRPSNATALAYKQALSLLIAQRRPSYYLGDSDSDLEQLTDSHLRLLGNEGVISSALRDAALAVKLVDVTRARPSLPAASFVTRKASTAVRTQLAGLLGTPRLYDLDRLDLSVASTLDGTTQKAVTSVLRDLRNADTAKTAGLQGKGLLGKGDPANVVYSFTLLERGDKANYLRLQTDNYDQPLDINDGAKLDLGSTAKLRTLVSYLDIVANLHQRYGALDPAQQREIVLDPQDKISRWALDYLLQNPGKELAAMLQAALERRYSASPAESFMTGGGLHTFNNFRNEDNGKVMSIREGLRNSVNLVFVRLMRDVVHHYMFQVPGSSATLLHDVSDPRRATYLSRFADREGREFIYRFLNKYQGKSPEEAEKLLLQNVRPTPNRLAGIFRTIAPEAGMDQFTAFFKDYRPSDRALDSDRLLKLYEQFSADKMSLADRGYLASVHPLELWVVGYLRGHPAATGAQVIAASAAQRQEVYHWLFSTSRKQAQDKRILNLLEVEGFLEIHRQWKRMGYPFDSLVPSYATALGASADRPAALAELMGILVNGGLRKPTERIKALHFAAATPYETRLQRQPGKSEQVLAPEVAQAALGVIREVVDEGTAKRVKNAFIRADGSVIRVGGKTGTGDHRFDVYGGHGQLLESRVVNRSATFVFNIGERFFGSITAYVHGPQAANYDFTSALPVQLLKVLAPSLMPLMEPTADNTKPTEQCRN